MSGDELIEALALAQYESTWGCEDHTSWADLHPDTRETVRDVIRHNGWPLVVDFVAQWLDSHVAVVPDGRGGMDRASVRWREEMGA